MARRVRTITAADSDKYPRRMSGSDMMMWVVERDPALRSTMTAVTLLDRSPDRAKLMEKLDRASRLIPRLRQRPLPTPFGLAPPRWAVDPNFNLDYHMRWVRAGGDRSVRELLDLAASLGMQDFDRARPLWEMTVVEDLADGRAAIIQKMHHSVTDGVGGMELALNTWDDERHPTEDLGPMPPEPPGEDLSQLRLLAEGLQYQLGRLLALALWLPRFVARIGSRPTAEAQRMATEAASLKRLMGAATKPMSPVMTGRSLSAHLDTVAVPLDEVKAAAKRAGGSVNDAVLTAVTGGLARYHQRMGAPATALRLAMPINIRPEDGEELGGNQFVPVRFEIPIAIADPAERFQAIKALVRQQRSEPALPLFGPVVGVFTRMAVAVTKYVGSLPKGIDFNCSNVAGAPFPLYFAGAKIEATFGFPPIGGCAVSIVVLSYLNELHVGLVTDPAAVTAPDVLRECIEEGFTEVRKLAASPA